MTVNTREVWQRGPIDGFAPELQPAVHALLQASEEIEQHASSLSHDVLWAKPFDVASIGFHLLHLAGSTDRLLTYAQGETLSSAQMDALRAEQTPLGPDVSSAQLVARVQASLQQALEQIRALPPSTFQEARYIGRARLPTTVWGLVFHAAEHASRHVGQLVTTVKIARVMGGGNEA